MWELCKHADKHRSAPQVWSAWDFASQFNLWSLGEPLCEQIASVFIFYIPHDFPLAFKSLQMCGAALYQLMFPVVSEGNGVNRYGTSFLKCWPLSTPDSLYVNSDIFWKKKKIYIYVYI